MAKNLIWQLRDFATRAEPFPLPRPQIRDVAIIVGAIAAFLVGVL